MFGVLLNLSQKVLLLQNYAIIFCVGTVVFRVVVRHETEPLTIRIIFSKNKFLNNCVPKTNLTNVHIRFWTGFQKTFQPNEYQNICVPYGTQCVPGKSFVYLRKIWYTRVYLRWRLCVLGWIWIKNTEFYIISCRVMNQTLQISDP